MVIKISQEKQPTTLDEDLALEAKEYRVSLKEYKAHGAILFDRLLYAHTIDNGYNDGAIVYRDCEFLKTIPSIVEKGHYFGKIILISTAIYDEDSQLIPKLRIGRTTNFFCFNAKVSNICQVAFKYRQMIGEDEYSLSRFQEIQPRNPIQWDVDWINRWH